MFKRNERTRGVEESKYKASLIAKEYNQVSGVDFTDVDFTDVFSSIVKYSSIWVLLCIVALHDLELGQMDLKTTVIHDKLDEDIYVQ